jgi:hypothetical protein
MLRATALASATIIAETITNQIGQSVRCNRPQPPRLGRLRRLTGPKTVIGIFKHARITFKTEMASDILGRTVHEYPTRHAPC